MATELTDLDLEEWSICIDPANEDCTIDIVKSKTGLGPVLKETDMSEHNEDLEIDGGEGDAEFEQFAEGVIEEFNDLSEDEQVEALVGMAARNEELEAAVEDAGEVIKSLTENSVSREKYDELKKSATLLMDRITKSGAKDEDGLLAEVRKSLAPGQELSPEAIARIEAIEKAQNETAVEKAVAKAKTFGFGSAQDVAGLSMRIRKALGDKDADLYESQIKQAGAVVKSAPHFKTIGEDAGNADATSPIAKCNAAVGDIRKAHPNLTEAQAKAKYWDENPAEYAAYRAEQRGANAA